MRMPFRAALYLTRLVRVRYPEDSYYGESFFRFEAGATGRQADGIQPGREEPFAARDPGDAAAAGRQGRGQSAGAVSA